MKTKAPNLLEQLRKDRRTLGDEAVDLYVRAERGDESILSHPKVSFYQDENGVTPLHVLASKGIASVFWHPMVEAVSDNNAVTPLRYLAKTGNANAKARVQEIEENDYPDGYALTNRKVSINLARVGAVLDLETFALVFPLHLVLSFFEWKVVPYRELGAILDVDEFVIAKSIKKLVEIGFLLVGPPKKSVPTYKLNEDFEYTPPEKPSHDRQPARTRKKRKNKKQVELFVDSGESV